MYNSFAVYAYKQITFFGFFRVDSSAKANSVTHENIFVSSWKPGYPLASYWFSSPCGLFCFPDGVAERETQWAPKGCLFLKAQIISLLLSEEKEIEEEEEDEGRK